MRSFGEESAIDTHLKKEPHSHLNEESEGVRAQRLYQQGCFDIGAQAVLRQTHDPINTIVRLEGNFMTLERSVLKTGL